MLLQTAAKDANAETPRAPSRVSIPRGRKTLDAERVKQEMRKLSKLRPGALLMLVI